MSYQNDPSRPVTREQRRTGYIWPLAILAIAIVLGFMVVGYTDDTADNLANTAPAAGSPTASDNPAANDYTPNPAPAQP
jgi:Na+/proline symporter